MQWSAGLTSRSTGCEQHGIRRILEQPSEQIELLRGEHRKIIRRSARRWQEGAADTQHEQAARGVGIRSDDLVQWQWLCVARALAKALDVLLGETGDEAFCPLLRGVLINVLRGIGVEVGALLLGHADRIGDAASHLLDVKGVDAHTARAERLSSACKLGQHQHALLGVLARNVLVGDKVHAVAQRGDDADVGDVVEGNHLLKVDRLIKVMDRRVARRAEPAIDPADEAMCHRAQPLILGNLGARRHGNLQQHDLADEVGARCEEGLHREELLWDAFDVIDSIDPKHNLDALKLLPKLHDALLYLRRLEALAEARRVDTNGERIHLQGMLYHTSATLRWHGPLPSQPCARGGSKRRAVSSKQARRRASGK